MSKYFTSDEVKARKKSDTLVILGSGSSINDLSDKFWEKCKDDCDTLAINWWVYHWYVPTFWMFELTLSDQHQLDIWKNKVSDKKYKDVVWMHTRHGSIEKFEKHFDSNVRCLFPEDTKFFLYERGHHKDWTHDIKKIFKDCEGRIDRYFMPAKCTGTLLPAISFGVQMGYKKIVLAGIDLGDSLYFWTDYDEDVHRRTNYHRSKKQLHLTEQQDDKNVMSMSNVVKALDDFVLKPRGIKIFVTSKKSVLYPNVLYTQLDNELPKHITFSMFSRSPKRPMNFVSRYDLKCRKKSDSLIILGTGLSINDLDENFWKLCKVNDTLAINWWIYHWHVPTFWFMESSWNKREKYVWDKRITERKDDYRDVTWLYFKRRPGTWGVSEDDVTEVFENVIFPRFPDNSSFWMYDRRVYLEWPNNLRNLFEYFRNDLRTYFLPTSTTGSLICAIDFAYKMGYKSIILAGIDLNNSYYFWSFNDEYVHRRVDDGYIYGKGIHTTESRIKIKDYPISQAVMDVNDQVLKPAGIKMLVASEKSLLYPFIPCLYVPSFSGWELIIN